VTELRPAAYGYKTSISLESIREAKELVQLIAVKANAL